MALGTNHTSLGARLRGETAFLAEDLESIAQLLKRDPVGFYGSYLAAGDAPEPSPLTVQTREVEGNLTHVEFGRPDRDDVVPRPLVAIGAVR